MSFRNYVKHHFFNFVRVDVGWLVVCKHATTIRGTDKAPLGHFRYVLYESKYGVRKYEATEAIAGHRIFGSFKDDKFYTDWLLPWEKGIRIPGIDTYEQALQQQAIDILAGK